MAAFLLILSLLASPAPAGGKEAEHVRLKAEIESLVARNAWKGADRLYVQMAALGVPLTYEDHWLGAQAAKALGNVNETHRRLEAAAAVDGTEIVYEELALLFAAYGMVRLKVSNKVEAPELTALDMPFDPVMRRTIEGAAATIGRDHRYVGLLPLGRYELAGTRFDVIGAPLVKVKAR